MKTKNKILEILKQNNNYVSGEDMASRLNLSRNSIWKNIKKLKEEGFEIDSVKNRGYMLIREPEELSDYVVKNELKNYDYIEVLKTVESTNDLAKEVTKKVKTKGLIVAKEQTKGRGRRGREWVSKSNVGTYMSFILKPEISPKNVATITLVAGLAICKAINKLYNLDAKIKWPNDIVIDGKKVCGILTELSTEIDHINYIVVGIGINTEEQKFSKELEQKATSIINEIKKKNKKVEIKDNELVINIAKYFEKYLQKYFEENSFECLSKEYDSLCVNIGSDVAVHGYGETYIGKCVGINADGELLVQSQGSIRVVEFGEVSVRGVYGYV